MRYISQRKLCSSDSNVVPSFPYPLPIASSITKQKAQLLDPKADSVMN